MPPVLVGGRSAGIDARANRWDAEEYQRLKEQRDKLKAEIDVSLTATCSSACWPVDFLYADEQHNVVYATALHRAGNLMITPLQQRVVVCVPHLFITEL